MNLFSNSINALEQGLNSSSLRQKVISNNIANIDTPNYKAKTVSFKDELTQAVSVTAKRTNPRHFDFTTESSNSQFVIKENQGNSTYNNNGNSVDIDKEMANLAKNQIYYNALIGRLNIEFSSLKTVIGGGR